MQLCLCASLSNVHYFFIVWVAEINFLLFPKPFSCIIDSFNVTHFSSIFFFKNFYLYNAINADKQLLVAYINATKTSVLSRKPTVKADIVPPNVAIIWLNQHHDICRLNVECSFLITVDTQSNSEKNLKMIISLETVLTSTKKKVKSFTWTLAKVKILVTT